MSVTETDRGASPGSAGGPPECKTRRFKPLLSCYLVYVHHGRAGEWTEEPHSNEKNRQVVEIPSEVWDGGPSGERGARKIRRGLKLISFIRDGVQTRTPDNPLPLVRSSGLETDPRIIPVTPESTGREVSSSFTTNSPVTTLGPVWFGLYWVYRSPSL